MLPKSQKLNDNRRPKQFRPHPRLFRSPQHKKSKKNHQFLLYLKFFKKIAQHHPPLQAKSSPNRSHNSHKKRQISHLFRSKKKPANLEHTEPFIPKTGSKKHSRPLPKKI